MFNTEMQDLEIGDLDLNFVINGPESPYTVSWKSEFVDDFNFKISYSCSPPLVGVPGEEIVIEIFSSLSFVSQEGTKMVEAQIMTMDVSDPNSSQGAEAASSGAAVAFIIGLVVSVGVSVLTGGSIELMWSFTNTLQVLFFYGLMNLYFSSDLKSVFEFMSYSNFKNPLRDIISDFISKYIDIPGSPISANFEEMGFPQTNIIANSIDKLLVLSLIIACMVAVVVIIKYTKDYDNKYTRFLQKLDVSIRFNSVGRFMLELMLYMAISCMITVVYGSFESLAGIIAFSVAFIILAVLVAFQFYTLLYPIIFFEEIQFDPTQFERHRILFEVFKSDSYACLRYYFYFVSRRLWLAFIFVTYKDYTKGQIVSIIAVNLMILRFQLDKMPFKSILDNILSSINEGILVLFSSILFLFLNEERTTQIVRSSYLGIGIIAFFFLVNWAIIAPVMVSKIF